MAMRPRTIGSLLGAVAALCAAGLALAAEPAPGADKSRPPVIDPVADRVLKSMSDYLREAKQFSVRADITYDEVLPSGQKIQLSAVQDTAVRRPDRVYSQYEGDEGARRLWYDGKQLTLLDDGAGVYAAEAMPPQIDAVLDRLLAENGFQPPLSDLLYSDPYAVLMKGTVFGIYAGQHVVDGVRTHHLAFVQPDIDWQIWVEDGTQLVPRKVLITYKRLPSQPQFEARLSHWELDTRLADGTFEPLIPADAVKIDLLAVAPATAPDAKQAETKKAGAR